MSHQASHFGVKKKWKANGSSGGGGLSAFARMKPVLDPSADRIWTIGQIIYQRHQAFNRNSAIKSQDNGSFDYIDMVSQSSLDRSTEEERRTVQTDDVAEIGMQRPDYQMYCGEEEISEQFVKLNVGGQRFMLRKDTIRRRGVGRLLDLINKPVADSNADAFFSSTSEFYFERPPSLFHIVYQFYLNGVIHQPSNLCPVDIIEELEYWRIIPDQYLASCCCAQQIDDDDEEVEEQDKPNLFKTLRFGEIRRCVWNIIEEPASSGKAQAFAVCSVVFVLISISGLVLGSLPELQVATKQRNNLTGEEFTEMEPMPILGYIEYVCIVWFTMEYGLKMLVSAERSKTFRQLLNIIDLLAILPFIIEMLLLIFGISTEQLRDLKGAFLVIRILRVLRVIRVLKLGRYSSGLQMFGKTLKASFRQLGMMAMVVMTGVIFFSTLVYFLEKDEPASKFHSIPAACWWCIVTMTTVGYGDLTPVTVPGKLVATGAIACGVLVLALPITIIVDNFMKVAETERPAGGNRYRTSQYPKATKSEQMILKVT
ncbi:putative voltage-gated potassium channel subunit kvs-4 [Caenorhabditis elegans]|uniref:putative voltage-gated potassium channel subunit kvs-4 n=1 Tax=Caenorhabditis elegans TaxID=6239 RepID=UPI0000083B48|nr:putative voltage-gated potassium channel subunit kvs-4 [Caenorhabditis elegans]CAH04760.2 Probable voltage-gated potassium channel subunit kvs-4 [Caenorhabditis elegans]